MDYYGQNREANEIANGIALQMVRYGNMKKQLGGKILSSFSGGSANVQGS